jgi:nucleotide-binding universal stress UspA family protein
VQQIVVGLDGSPGSLTALHWAADEARAHGATLRVLAAWHPSAVSSLPAWGVAEPVETALAELLEGLRETLAAEGVVAGDGLAVESVVVEGHPAGALIEAATTADLVVVGRRGHGGFSGMLLGSVSQHVAAHAACPVVVVPPGS